MIIPGMNHTKSNVTIYNRNENALNLPNSFDIGDEDSDIYISYDNLAQELPDAAIKPETFQAATLGAQGKILDKFGDVKDAGGGLLPCN